MDHLLPPVFIAIAAFCLCFGLYAVWQSLRGLFEARTGPARVIARSEREQLVEQKFSLLRALKELRLERDLGKISDQDFDALDARYRAQAKKVLRALDAQLGDYRNQAAALIDAELRSDGSGNASAEVPEGSQVTDPSPDPAQPSTGGADGKICAGCSTRNDPDAVFCKKCGRRVSGGDEATRDRADGDAARGDVDEGSAADPDRGAAP